MIFLEYFFSFCLKSCKILKSLRRKFFHKSQQNYCFSILFIVSSLVFFVFILKITVKSNIGEFQLF